MIDFDVAALVREQDGYLRSTRGYLHRRPELSGNEVDTSAYLKEQVSRLGLSVVPVAGPGETGFIAVLDTGRAGRCVCLRADIDGLPIDEDPQNLAGSKRWVSERPGVCHACGHDGHMAIMLAAMRVLSGMRDRLRGTVLFAFEEGEETCCGIDAMVAALGAYPVDAVFGVHLVSFLDTGQVCIDDGPVMSAMARVDFTVHGKGGHGSRPDEAISPLFATAQILSGLSSAWVNQVAVDQTVTLGIGEVSGGCQWNVIPDTCHVAGSLRYFDEQAGEDAYRVLEDVTRHTAAAHRCRVSFADISGPTLPPVVNDARIAATVRRRLDAADYRRRRPP